MSISSCCFCKGADHKGEGRSRELIGRKPTVLGALQGALVLPFGAAQTQSHGQGPPSISLPGQTEKDDAETPGHGPSDTNS